MTLANIYALNNDDPFFFKNVFKHLLTFEYEEIILKYIVDSLDLTDIWRFLNADTKTFCWRRRNPEIQCRLNFFLISTSLISTT